MTNNLAIDDIVQTLQQLSDDKVQQARHYVRALAEMSDDVQQVQGRAVLDLLEEMRRTSFTPPPGFPCVEDLVREDRDR